MDFSNSDQALYKDELLGMFIKHFGSDLPEGSTPVMTRLPGQGSSRVYYRISDSCGLRTAIGVVGDNPVENRSFVGLARLFRKHGVNVPEIFGVGESGYTYLQEDLGGESLFSMLASEDRDELLRKSIAQLVKMQLIPRSEWDSLVYTSGFSHRQVMWDLNYFKYEFLKPLGITFNEQLLEDDFERIVEDIESSERCGWGFMYRDFQSRNIMVQNDEAWLIDFQGGMYGPVLYDAVSLLWQAKAGFDSEFRKKFLGIYIKEYCGCSGTSPDALTAQLPALLLVRNLQVLGAYGLRGLVESKAHFLESISKGLENLRGLLDDDYVAKYPELERVCRAIVGLPQFAIGKSDGRLEVTVFSFSYKKGYPKDFSGNGGGFMFDCRGMHNPGRYAEYKTKTGLDKEVKDFLEERGEVIKFLENVCGIINPTVRRYVNRGFSSLQIGFGCTGGQHRSVYCAEHLARHLAIVFPEVRVRIIHREQGIEEILNDSI